MKFILPIILYFAIAIAIMQNMFILAGIFICMFSLRYGALALILLAIMIDGYFGNFATVPWLSFTSLPWYLLAVYIRPKIVNLRIIDKYESFA
jgi:hypothetical protein